MHGQKLKIFKRPKNREDGSDFDDFRTKNIAATQAVHEKCSNERNERKVPEKFKNYRFFFKQKTENNNKLRLRVFIGKCCVKWPKQKWPNFHKMPVFLFWPVALFPPTNRKIKAGNRFSVKNCIYQSRWHENLFQSKYPTGQFLLLLNYLIVHLLIVQRHYG